MICPGRVTRPGVPVSQKYIAIAAIYMVFLLKVAKQKMLLCRKSKLGSRSVTNADGTPTG